MLNRETLGAALRLAPTWHAIQERIFWISAFVLFLCPPWFLRAQQIASVFPLGGQRGSTLEVKLRGQSLEGASAVVFDCEALRAQVTNVVEIAPEKKNEGPPPKIPAPPLYQVVLAVQVDAAAPIGPHTLRLVTPRGVSNPALLQLHSEAVAAESENPHDTPALAQLVGFPVVVNGRITQKGERDYYAFEVHKGQELRFEVLTGSGLFQAAPAAYREPTLALYEPTGSWFDAERVTRLEVADESIFLYFPKTSYTSHHLPRLGYRFPKAGRYLAEVGAFGGQGGPDYSYQLRIVPAQESDSSEKKQWSLHAPAHAGSDATWQERDFARKLDSDRLRLLWSRTVRVPRKKDEPVSGSGEVAKVAAKVETGLAETERVETSVPAPILISEPEGEPNETIAQAQQISIPSIIEGVIERPGDVDYFKFQVKPGEQLAFEVETPGPTFPYFSPRVGVLDEGGQEILTNIYRKVSGDGDDWVKTLEPKMTFTFEKGNWYYLQLRDLTSRYGSPDFSYRVLIRRQIAHIGEVAAKTFGNVGTERDEDRINLAPGKSKKLTVIAAREEGFDGEIALSIENLPDGVRAIPAASVAPEIASQPGQVYEMRGAVNKERFRPQRLATTVMLVATADAPATKVPRNIRLMAQPIVEGTLGAPFVVQQMSFMVVRPPDEKGKKE